MEDSLLPRLELKLKEGTPVCREGIRQPIPPRYKDQVTRKHQEMLETGRARRIIGNLPEDQHVLRQVIVKKAGKPGMLVEIRLTLDCTYPNQHEVGGGYPAILPFVRNFATRFVLMIIFFFESGLQGLFLAVRTDGGIAEIPGISSI